MIGCPLCQSIDVSVFLERRGAPVTQNLIVRSREAARNGARGALEMTCCRRCGFVFNRAFDPAVVAYGAEYDNTQSHSPAFAKYMDELVDRLLASVDLRGRCVIEVGCGKGLFLRKLVERAGPSTIGWGFDPSYVGPDTELDGRLRFRRELYTPQSAAVRGDVVVSRHVIEHLQDPLSMLRLARTAMSDAPDARVFIETPTVEWILRNNVHWDLFYEHCSLFAPSTLSTALQLSGFQVESLAVTFGGQYMWAEATPTTAPKPTFTPGDIPDLAQRFALAEHQWISDWSSRLHARTTKTAIWGAGAKGVTFANLVDPTATLLDCVVDLNPQKQGHFLPGTGHPIVGPAELAARGVANAILMNPNYRAENLALLASLQVSVELEE
jgi:SAM-dependent methyltransferase